MTLLGTYRHVVDAKNRLFIPAKFREELGETFYITCKIMEKCLAVYSEEEWQKYSSKIADLPDSQVGKIKRIIFSRASQITTDTHGRILVPANLLSYAGIDKNAVISGVGDHVQIWNEEEWDRQDAEINLEEMGDLLMRLGL